MIKQVLVAAIAAGTIMTAGSGYATVAVRVQARIDAPAYCYDCHSRPVWSVGYGRCSYYSIRVGHGGYYYRPYRHTRHDNFRFRRSNFSTEKVIRTRR